MKKIFKIVIFALIGTFLFLYFSYKNGYLDELRERKKILTDEMILKFEDDLKNGLDVTKIDYHIKENDYSNVYTNGSLKISDDIHNILDGIIKHFFRKINNFIEE